jgi:CubicO group peptidase (beta-lactamase class C family)
MKQILTTALLLLTTATVAAAQSFDFPTAEPERFGIDSALLQAHGEEMFRRGTEAYMIVYHDKVIYERYLPEWNRYRPHGTASAAKGIMGGLSLMLAMHDGLIELDDFAHKYIPEWRNDPLKSKITIRQLGAHTSGLDDSTEAGTNQNTLPGWKGDFWRRERNPFVISRDEAPVIFAPGTSMKYSNPGIGMLNYAVTAAIKDTEHPDIRTYLWERLLSKMEIPQAEWSVGYGQTYETNGLSCVATWGGGSVSTRAMAAVGRLLANKGNWNGEQLIDAKVVEAVLRHSGTPSTCSGGFWLNADMGGKKTWVDMPWDTAMASGAQDQVMIFSPSRNLVIVRFGYANIEPGRFAENVINRYIGAPLMNALPDIAPYPRSETITGID